MQYIPCEIQKHNNEHDIKVLYISSSAKRKKWRKFDELVRSPDTQVYDDVIDNFPYRN